MTKVFQKINTAALILILCLSLFTTWMVWLDTCRSENISVSFELLDTQDRNYTFYTSIQETGYPFYNNETKQTLSLPGRDFIQELTFTVKRDSVKHVRLDFGLPENAENNVVYIYSMTVFNGYNRQTMNADALAASFTATGGAHMAQDGNRIRVEVGGSDPYIEATGGLALTTSPFSPYLFVLKLLFAFLLSCLLFYGCYFFFKKARNYPYKKKSTPIVIYLLGILLLPFFFAWCTAFLQYGSFSGAAAWLASSPAAFFSTYLLYLFFFGVFALAGAFRLGSLLTGLIAVVMPLANIFKIQYRSTPVLPWDLGAVGTLKNVFSELNLTFTNTMFFGIYFAVLIFCLSFLFGHFAKDLSRKKRAALSLSCLLCLVLYIPLGIVMPKAQEVDNLTGQHYIEYFDKEGVWPAFISCYHLSKTQKPYAYSQEAVQEVLAQIQVSDTTSFAESTSQQNPNIIFIMSESFWDIQNIPELQFEEELLPTLNELRKTAAHGNTFSPFFGGNTGDVEFQALTGFTDLYLNPGTPYREINAPFFSIASYLKNKNYTTLAIHPYYGDSWKRNVAYPNLGFDDFLTIDDFENPQYERGFISDQAAFERIIQEYEKHKASSENPWFNFTVTVQNHTDYDGSNYPADQQVAFTASGLSEDVVDQVKDFATGVHSSDLALQKLIDYFRTEERPTLIIFFGDHASGLGNSADNIFAQSAYTSSGDAIEYTYKTHLTPLIAWSNYKELTEDVGTVSTYQILPCIMDLYGLETPGWFQFLSQVRQSAKGYCHDIVINPDGSLSTQLSEEQAEYYKKYQLLQYDYIYGQRYAENQLFW